MFRVEQRMRKIRNGIFRQIENNNEITCKHVMLPVPVIESVHQSYNKIRESGVSDYLEWVGVRNAISYMDVSRIREDHSDFPERRREGRGGSNSWNAPFFIFRYFCAIILRVIGTCNEIDIFKKQVFIGVVFVYCKNCFV